ncbi:hypothetical protein M271_13440 [Streptomyces rapamycinicus NRRL 5491]|nr:hypothetical protein M271_13440 [Streptomyces rapamycinicus NRRL 5491]
MSFRATTSWLMMAGSIARTPCGTSTDIMTWVFRRPSEYAASRWPRSTEFTPARNTSASTEPL